MKMPVNTMLRQTRRSIGIEALTPPVIGGSAAVGAVLDTVTASTWGEAVTLTYQWYRNSVPIDGATAETYTVVLADAGKTLLRRDTATAGVLTASQVSNSIGPIAEVILATNYINIIGTGLHGAGSVTTYTGYTADQRLRVSKPAAAASGGHLTWDAYSRWGFDADPTASGQPWLNDFSIYGNNGGADVLLFTFDDTHRYTTAALAFAGVAAVLPTEVSGYTTYKIAGFDDNPASDNRGGLSLKVEKVTPA